MLHVTIWFSLLFVFTGAIHTCKPGQMYDFETNQCEDLKCPTGQVWLEKVQQCVKFRRIVSGDEKDLLVEQEKGVKSCLDDFIWLPSLKMCAQSPKLCNNEACVKEKLPKSAADCPPDREWNEATKKCLKPKQVKTMYTEEPKTK